MRASFGQVRDALKRTHFSSIGDSAQDRVKNKARGGGENTLCFALLSPSASLCVPLASCGPTPLLWRIHVVLTRSAVTPPRCVPSQWDEFYERLERCLTAEVPYTLVLRDPLAGCFVAPSTDNPEEDAQIEITDFVRDWEASGRKRAFPPRCVPSTDS